LEGGSLVPEGDVTALLVEVANGNQAAQEELIPLVYDQLKKLARRYMRHERADHTLQTTALVHEAYLKLVRQQSPNWQGRAQFFGIAAQLMRRILDRPCPPQLTGETWRNPGGSALG
jgi:RNA polymerase sigma-70 factor (ECF subfamily)